MTGTVTEGPSTSPTCVGCAASALVDARCPSCHRLVEYLHLALKLVRLGQIEQDLSELRGSQRYQIMGNVAIFGIVLVMALAGTRSPVAYLGIFIVTVLLEISVRWLMIRHRARRYDEVRRRFRHEIGAPSGRVGAEALVAHVLATAAAEVPSVPPGRPE